MQQKQAVDPVLGLMIYSQAVKRLGVATRAAKLVEGDVQVIALLSAELRAQLRHELFAPGLRGQALWKTCDCIDDQILNLMCKFAIEAVNYDPGQVLFETGAQVDHAYIVAFGSLKYTLSMCSGTESMNIHTLLFQKE